MPTQPQVLQTILSARLKMAKLSTTYANNLTAGFKAKGFDFIKRLYLWTNAVNRQYILQDYSSPNFLKVYDCLCKMVGVDASVNFIDPNYQGSNTVININNVFAGTNVVRGIITFNNVTSLELANYNTTYKQIYGNKLIQLDIFLTAPPEYIGDYQDPPNITYLIPNDPTTDITDISWNFAIPVSGYLAIAGIIPVTGDQPSGGSDKIIFPFTQANLLYDSVNLQWYLPLVLPTNIGISYVEVNGISQGTTYDRPNSRLYAFAANTIAQLINVSVI